LITIRHVLLIEIKRSLLRDLLSRLESAEIVCSLYYWPESDQAEHPRLSPSRGSFDLVIIDCADHHSVLTLYPWGEGKLITDLGEYSDRIVALTDSINLPSDWHAVARNLRRWWRNLPEVHFCERNPDRILEAINQLRQREDPPVRFNV
jgi:hypothetical protein